MKISTSFLSCKKVLPTIKLLSYTDTDFIHVDYIDGKFVKGRKIPFRILKKISKISSKRLDVHLMTDKLNKFIKKFATLNCEYITFHVEATKNVEKYIHMIHNYGIKCGLAINPDTDISVIEPYLEMVDLVLVMGVVPGKGGQSFIEETPNKIKNIKSLIVSNKLHVVMNVDGGINDETIKKVSSYVDMAVSGSFVTNAENYQEQINKLR